MPAKGGSNKKDFAVKIKIAAVYWFYPYTCCMKGSLVVVNSDGKNFTFFFYKIRFQLKNRIEAIFHQ